MKEYLVPGLHPCTVVVLGNASFQKSQRTKEFTEDRGDLLALYLLLYPPDLNALEHDWVLLKLSVRKYSSSFDIFYQILDV